MKLILLNGPWGVGKSTVARLLHETLSRSLYIELDAIRRAIQGYEDDREAGFCFAVKVTQRIIEECIADKRDAIVDKMFFVPSIIDEIVQRAKEHGAEVYEIVLWADLPTVLARGAMRGYSEVFSEEKARHAWYALAPLITGRLQATVIDTTHLTPNEALVEVQRVIVEKTKIAP